MASSSITGWFTQVDSARFDDMFSRSAEHSAAFVRVLALDGLAEAQLCYGRMLLGGTGIDKNECEALLWFKRAAAQGNLDAVNLVGRCLEHGWGTDVDVIVAAAYYHQAADAGHSWAQYNLGHLYLDGIGVARDPHRAFTYYLRAASQEHARAMNLVARCCEEGWGAPVDFAAAADWYRRSAEAGYFRGQYNWASILLNANRSDEAASWFERAASSGTPAVREAVLRVAALPDSPAPVAALAGRLRRDTAAVSS